MQLGKAWIFPNNAPSKPTTAMQRPYPPGHPRPNHTREAQQSMPPAGFPANMPGGNDLRKALCLKRKKKKSKLSRGRAQPRLARGPGSAELGPQVLRLPGLNGGRRRDGRGCRQRSPGAGGVPGGAASPAGQAGGNAARPRPCSRAGRRPGGGGKSGNLQPPVLGLKLPVHGQREAEEAPGVPGFPDHIFLAGVQVEGSAEPGQETRGQVEQPQLPRGRHGRAQVEGSWSRGGRPALGAGFEAAALLLLLLLPPARRGHLNPLRPPRPAPPPGRVALSAWPLPLAGCSRWLNEPVVLWRLAGVLSSDENAGPAPPHPSGPSSRARRPARCRHLTAGPGALRPRAAPPRPAPRRSRSRLPGPEAGVGDRDWGVGRELPARQPRPGGPLGKQHGNCGCHSAPSQKGVYYLLARTNAGVAPALIALSSGFSPTQTHVQVRTSFGPQVFMERLTRARYSGKGAAWVVFSPLKN